LSAARDSAAGQGGRPQAPTPTTEAAEADRSAT
jgi:hypothetical protein